jgi:hypothetical protein
MTLTPFEFRIGFSIKHVEDRHRCALDVLRSAREGTLAADWRGELIATADSRRRPHSPGFQRHDDVTSVIAIEIADWPRRSWEPYAAGGDWRAALEAWYQDELAVQDIYEDMAREHLVTPEPTETAWWRREQRCRDRLGASYRAGLAAGGDAVDWVGWYQQRIRGREETDPARIWVRDRIAADVPELGPTPSMEQLPQYWIQPAA